jgi:hypothetical protein
VYRRELARIAEQLANDAERLPVRDGTVRDDHVIAILDRAERGLELALPYPELAPLRDSLAALFGQVRQELLGEKQGEARVSRIFVLAAAKPVDAGLFHKTINALVALFRTRSEASPLRELCVATTPEQHATVVLSPASFPSDTIPVDSNQRVTLYLGRYVYDVSRTGFDPMSGSIDLFLDPKPVMECVLMRGSSEKRSCRTLAQPLERCQ